MARAESVEAWLDEDAQVVRQRVAGAMDLEDFNRLEALTAKCRQRLRDPANMHILVDAGRMRQADLQVRRHSMGTLRRPELRRMAFFGGGALTRVLLLFAGLALGTDKARAFRTEKEALEWLLQ